MMKWEMHWPLKECLFIRCTDREFPKDIHRQWKAQSHEQNYQERDWIDQHFPERQVLGFLYWTRMPY